jgi:hypothetical protein
LNTQISTLNTSLQPKKKNAETFCKLSYHWKLLQFSSANQPSKSKMKTFGKNQTSRYGHPDKAWDGDDD